MNYIAGGYTRVLISFFSYSIKKKKKSFLQAYINFQFKAQKVRSVMHFIYFLFTSYVNYVSFPQLVYNLMF